MHHARHHDVVQAANSPAPITIKLSGLDPGKPSKTPVAHSAARRSRSRRPAPTKKHPHPSSARSDIDVFRSSRPSSPTRVWSPHLTRDSASPRKTPQREALPNDALKGHLRRIASNPPPSPCRWPHASTSRSMAVTLSPTKDREQGRVTGVRMRGCSAEHCRSGPPLPPIPVNAHKHSKARVYVGTVPSPPPQALTARIKVTVRDEPSSRPRSPLPQRACTKPLPRIPRKPVPDMATCRKPNIAAPAPATTIRQVYRPPSPPDSISEAIDAQWYEEEAMPRSCSDWPLVPEPLRPQKHTQMHTQKPPTPPASDSDHAEGNDRDRQQTPDSFWDWDDSDNEQSNGNEKVVVKKLREALQRNSAEKRAKVEGKTKSEVNSAVRGRRSNSGESAGGPQQKRAKQTPRGRGASFGALLCGMGG